MKITVLGPRVLCRAYTLPEKIGSIYVPEYTQTQFDGKSFEVVVVGEEVSRRLAVGMVNGDTIYPVLADGVKGLDPLVLEPDDIIILRHQWRGVWAGPEIRDFYGVDCWFVGAVEMHGAKGLVPAIEKVMPCKAWKETDLDAA